MTTAGTSTAQDRAAQNAAYAAEHGFIMMARTIVGTDKAEAYDPATGTFIDPGADGILSDDDKRRSIDSLTCTEKVNLCQAAQAIKPTDLQAILDAGNDRLDALILGYRDGSLNPESMQCAPSLTRPPEAEANTTQDAAATDAAAQTPATGIAPSAPQPDVAPVVRGIAGGWGAYRSGRTDGEGIMHPSMAGAAHENTPAVQPSGSLAQQQEQWMTGFISWLMQNPAILSLIQMSGQVRYTGI